MDEHRLALSALQHFAYCPRQCALIHTEQAWADNFFTAQGNALHERVDQGAPEQRKGVRFERSVAVESEMYGLHGKLDLLEIETNPDTQEKQYFPVEYKRGKPKIEDWDRIQLCAQGLCIEEMRQTKVSAGAIWYWQERKREHIAINAALRATTLQVIEATRSLLASQATPPPTAHKARCKACSLVDICQPSIFRTDRSAKYVAQIFIATDESAVLSGITVAGNPI
jgi:CRISPR-associated exonuclease Cas4